jgi:hypothetical protein
MRFSLGILAIVFAAIECTEAVPWGGPEPTPAGELDRQGISPRPTSGPQIEVLELLKRQSTGNPRTCGFIERSPGTHAFLPIPSQLAMQNSPCQARSLILTYLFYQ